MAYRDSFDYEEFEIFRQFNNGNERKSRHVDTFFLDNPEETKEQLLEKARTNEKTLLKDTLSQIESNPDFFPALKKDQVVKKDDEDDGCNEC